MHEFTDSKGRTWSLVVNIGAIRRVREVAAFDLCQILEGDSGLALKLDTDMVLLAAVLWALCKDAAAAAGKVERSDFENSLTGEVLAKAAEALWEEISCFFLPCRPLIVGRLLEASLKAAKRADANSQPAASASGSGSTNSPGNAASAQTPTPSASCSG